MAADKKQSGFDQEENDITHLAFLPLNDFGADSSGFSSDDPADPFVDVRFESEPSPETGSFVSPTMLELT